MRNLYRSLWSYTRFALCLVVGILITSFSLVLAYSGRLSAIELAFPQTPTWRYRVDSEVVVLTVAILWFIIGVLFSIGGAKLINRGRRILIAQRRKNRPTTKRDIIYLRPFNADTESQKTQPTVFVFMSFKTYEEQITNAFETLGEVYAVSDPDEKLEPIGATHEPLADPAWQPEVREWIRQARLILIRASSGRPAVVWEVKQTLLLNRAESMLLLVPDDRTEYDEFVAATRHLFPFALPRWDFNRDERNIGNAVGIILFDANKKPTLVRLRRRYFSLVPLERALRRVISRTPTLRDLKKLAPRSRWKRAGRAVSISLFAILTLSGAIFLSTWVSPVVDSLSMHALSVRIISEGRLGPYLDSLPREFGSQLRTSLNQNASARRKLERSKSPEFGFPHGAMGGIQKLSGKDLLVLANAFDNMLNTEPERCSETVRAMVLDPDRRFAFFEFLTRSSNGQPYAEILTRSYLLSGEASEPTCKIELEDWKPFTLALGLPNGRRFVRLLGSDRYSIKGEDACWFQETWLRIVPTLQPETRRECFLRHYFKSYFPR